MVLPATEAGNMKIVLMVAVILIMGVCAMLVAKKLIEGIINYSVISKKENKHDVSKQRHGIVYNKKDRKLEADQSTILPF